MSLNKNDIVGSVITLLEAGLLTPADLDDPAQLTSHLVPPVALRSQMEGNNEKNGLARDVVRAAYTLHRVDSTFLQSPSFRAEVIRSCAVRLMGGEPLVLLPLFSRHETHEISEIHEDNSADLPPILFLDDTARGRRKSQQRVIRQTNRNFLIQNRVRVDLTDEELVDIGHSLKKGN